MGSISSTALWSIKAATSWTNFFSVADKSDRGKPKIATHKKLLKIFFRRRRRSFWVKKFRQRPTSASAASSSSSLSLNTRTSSLRMTKHKRKLPLVVSRQANATATLCCDQITRLISEMAKKHRVYSLFQIINYYDWIDQRDWVGTTDDRSSLEAS